MNRPTARRRLLVIATIAATALSSATGCSVLFGRPPPVGRPLASHEECSDSTLPALGDGYLAVQTAGVAVLAFAAALVQYQNNRDAIVPSWDPEPLRVDRSLFVIGGLSAAATAGLIESARYGMRSANACQAARAAMLDDGPTPGETSRPSSGWSR